MHLNSLDIISIGGIDSLSLEFNRNMNIICGPNGIGKTTILECVAQSFAGKQILVLKRKASSHHGEVKAHISDEGVPKAINTVINSFLPSEIHDFVDFDGRRSKHLLSLKIERTFKYVALKAVSKDIEKTEHNISEENKFGLNINEVKNWFVNRYLYSPHEDSLTSSQMYNFTLAKTFFSLLNDNYKFSKVDARSNEIIISTPTGEIFYEYLSSGFKSCLSILFGIVKELEFRFSEPGLKADEFEGVILIDELELHLHPEWQAKISNVLKEAFPKVQFIVTTHSPHIIQAAQPEEVIALQTDGGHVFKRPLPDTQYGFQGWTVEEVLRDVMGMEDTRTFTYHDTIKEFEKAVDEDNYTDAANAYAKLDALLHPENHLRKLLAFQLGALKG